MAYDRYTWVDGEVITAQKLNHIEEGIADGDNGYECTETREQLFEETVTTVAQGNYSVSNLGYSQQITAETLIVTFDGVEYNCPKQDVGGGYFVYGASTVSDFSQFPFSLGSSASGNIIYTQTAGEHSVKAVSNMATVTTTPCFEKAVNAAYDGVEIVDIVQTGTDSTTGKPLINFSYDDLGRIIQKYNNGKAVVRLQLSPNPSLNYYMGGDPRLYVDAFYATSSSMTGDRYVLHAHSTSVFNVSAHAIRIYDITLEVGRSSNSLAIEAIQISNQ